MALNPKRPKRGRTGQAEREAEKLHSEMHREDVVQLNVRIPAGLRKRLKIKAVEEDRDVADLVMEPPILTLEIPCKVESSRAYLIRKPHRKQWGLIPNAYVTELAAP